MNPSLLKHPEDFGFTNPPRRVDFVRIVEGLRKWVPAQYDFVPVGYAFNKLYINGLETLWGLPDEDDGRFFPDIFEETAILHLVVQIPSWLREVEKKKRRKK